MIRSFPKVSVVLPGSTHAVLIQGGLNLFNSFHTSKIITWSLKVTISAGTGTNGLLSTVSTTVMGCSALCFTPPSAAALACFHLKAQPYYCFVALI